MVGSTQLRQVWHWLFGHGLDDLESHKILLSSPSDFYWNVRCELCDKTVFRVGVISALTAGRRR